MKIQQILAARPIAVLIVSSFALLFATGCDQQPSSPAGPSQPGARTPNKPVQPDATPADSAMQSNANAPGERPAQHSGTPSAVAPTGGSEMVMPRPASTPQSDDPAVASFAGLTAPKPATWQYRAPAGTSGMRVAEYGVPGVEGSDQANIVVYQFPGGGTFEQNINRWKGQFKSADGAPVEAKTSELEADGMRIGVAELSGSYRGMNSAEFAVDHILIAAMIETDGNPVFVQLVGPSKTIEANREAFMTMLRGVKKSDPMK